jgi:predicted O-methyltransferase YrrM
MFIGRYDLATRNASPLPPPVPGITTAQFTWEFIELVLAYKALKPKYVVEIGTWHGGSLWFWLRYAAPEAQIVSVDMGPEHWRPAEPDFDASIWQDWIRPSNDLHVIKGDSKSPEVVDQVKSICPHIDFLFIDGDHSYEGSRADFESYGPLVRPGGVIAFHDLIPPKDRPRIQVGRLFREIQQAGYTTRELYSKPGQACMGIGVVYV